MLGYVADWLALLRLSSIVFFTLSKLSEFNPAVTDLKQSFTFEVLIVS